MIGIGVLQVVIEITDFNTYFVGDVPVLVHNYEVKSRIKEDSNLVKQAEKAGSDSRVQDEINNLINSFLAGNENPGIGSKALQGKIRYLRGKNGARVFYQIVGNTMEILGKASKKNEQSVINIVEQLFG